MRVLFLVYHFDKTRELSSSTALLSLWYGLRMDLSVAAYILAPVCIFVLLSLFIHFFRRLTIYYIYTFVLLFLVSFISLADLEIYTAWGFRIDATPLRFLSTPREALASISHLPLLLIAIIFLVCYGLFYWSFRKILRRIFFQEQYCFRILTGCLILVWMGALIIPIRGGFQLAPLNQSSVYFSTRQFANHAAINPSWNLLHSAVSKENISVNPYNYLPPAIVQRIVDSLYTSSGKPERIIRSSQDTPVNVIMLIWESFTEKAIHQKIDGREVTPNFNRLAKEGIFFSNAYASGDRTNKGIPAILSGYPAMPATTIIHSPGKSASLKVLSQLFREKGYSTPFFYGGEPEFANIKSYLLHGQFDPLVGKDDFAAKDMNSKWGAHDGVVMQRVLSDLQKTKQPFFATWLTLTSHEPFETPLPPVFRGNDNTAKFLNSIHYTDQVLGEFMENCRQAEWWDQTIIVITGDHGHPLPETSSKAEDFCTPVLWLGGALEKRGVTIDRVTSQLDIAAALAAQVGIDSKAFPFSKDPFDPQTLAWAFFTFNNGFGFVDEHGRLVFDNVGRQPVSEEGRVTNQHLEAGKAMMQAVFEDFIRR